MVLYKIILNALVWFIEQNYSNIVLNYTRS